MRNRLLRYAALLIWAAPGFATDTLADAGDLARHYAATATIALVPQEGLQRLSLPLPVLQASRSPQWADVRVLDRAGRPVPIA